MQICYIPLKIVVFSWAVQSHSKVRSFFGKILHTERKYESLAFTGRIDRLGSYRHQSTEIKRWFYQTASHHKCVIDLCLIVLFGLHRLPQPACRLGLCRLVRRRDHFDSDSCLLCLWTKTRYACYVRNCPDYFRRAGD